MEKKDLKLPVNVGELDLLNPHDRQLILDLKRHFGGIIHAVTRWCIATQIKRDKAAKSDARLNQPSSDVNSRLGKQIGDK